MPTAIGECFSVDQSAAVAFNKDQHIVVVGQQVTPPIRQTASFLGSKGIHVTCVEFTFFEAAGGGCLLSQEIVVGREHAKPRAVTSEPLPAVSKDKFLKLCDEHGRAVFSRILEWATHRSMSINWGNKGFSVGVGVGGARVVVCYPPPSVFKQALYTILHKPGGIESKISAPTDAIDRLSNAAVATGLFAPAGREWKCLIDRAFTDDEVDALVAWCESVAQAIVEHGPKAATPEQ